MHTLIILAFFLLVIIKTNIKKDNKTTGQTPSPKSQQPGKNKGLTKGNGTKASDQPQAGRNPAGKDGAKEAIPPK